MEKKKKSEETNIKQTLNVSVSIKTDGSSSEAVFEAALPPRSWTQKLLTLPSAFPTPDRCTHTHKRTEHVTVFLSYETSSVEATPKCYFIGYSDLISVLQSILTN